MMQENERDMIEREAETFDVHRPGKIGDVRNIRDISVLEDVVAAAISTHFAATEGCEQSREPRRKVKRCRWKSSITQFMEDSVICKVYSPYDKALHS